MPCDFQWRVKVRPILPLFNEDTVICLQGLIRLLINTSDIIISLKGAEIAGPDNTYTCADTDTHAQYFSCSTMECSDQQHTIFQS